MKTKLDCHASQGTAIASRITISRMPVQYCVTVLKQSRQHHKDFGAAPFFSRTAVKPDFAIYLSGSDLFGDGNRRRSGSDAKQMVPATMTVTTRLNRLTSGNRLLG